VECSGVGVEEDEKEVLVHINGELQCGITDEWKEEVEYRVTETHDMMSNLIEHTSHLPKLSAIADRIDDISDKLISSATGKDHVGTPTVLLLLKIFGAVIMGLTAVIVYLLTGVHFGFINSLH